MKERNVLPKKFRGKRVQSLKKMEGFPPNMAKHSCISLSMWKLFHTLCILSKRGIFSQTFLAVLYHWHGTGDGVKYRSKWAWHTLKWAWYPGEGGSDKQWEGVGESIDTHPQMGQFLQQEQIPQYKGGGGDVRQSVNFPHISAPPIRIISTVPSANV